MLSITQHPDGCILLVHAQPGAKKSRVAGIHGDALKLAVTAPAQDGRANKALVQLLANLLDIPRRRIELLSGDTSREKRFLIRGLSRDELSKRLNAALAES